MTAVHFNDGFGGTFTVTGLGAYTNGQPIAGYTPFSSMTNTRVVACTVRTPTGFESGLYQKTGGTVPQLARIRIFRQIDQTQDAVTWGSAVTVTIVSGLSAEDVVALTASNTFEADQFMAGFKIGLSPDGGTGIRSATNGFLDFLISNSVLAGIGKGSTSETFFTLIWNDSGSSPGPAVNLNRVSLTPVHFDPLAYINFNGKNDTNIDITYCQLQGYIDVATTNSESGLLDFNIRRAGSAVLACEMGHHYTTFYPTLDALDEGVIVGKATTNWAAIGHEFLCNGHSVHTRSGAHPLTLNRLGAGSGTIVDLMQDTVHKASISLVGTTATFAGGTTSHESLWGEGEEPESEPPEGTLLCATGEIIDDGSGVHPFARVSRARAERTVFGIYGGPSELPVTLVDGTERQSFFVMAGGTWKVRAVGPVRNGDLLMSSDIPGVACAQGDEFWKSWSFAKATADAMGEGEQLVACTLKAS